MQRLRRLFIHVARRQATTTDVSIRVPCSVHSSPPDFICTCTEPPNSQGTFNYTASWLPELRSALRQTRCPCPVSIKRSTFTLFLAARAASLCAQTLASADNQLCEHTSVQFPDNCRPINVNFPPSSVLLSRARLGPESADTKNVW